ncbi:MULTISPECIES: hypothetical protein [unclassified Haloferax]|uniref:hypothetical protein n=1 Tax=unclassified Haloferax TaxID=2625095 RepID=UPI0028768E8C|nr:MULTISPECIES: hypothetical protein [unclassified Haloferax]MDS0243396.1 hypothetical protein [Haloferax sp. S2CR25]MDS0446517.1 hypothetical protein [Haloferax sp. S2CR25-2]
MRRKNIRLRKSQKKFVDDSSLHLSKLVRNAIDKAIAGERSYPTGSSRRTHSEEFERTTILINEAHEDFLQQENINFSQFIDDIIQERIEFERKLNRLDKGR